MHRTALGVPGFSGTDAERRTCIRQFRCRRQQHTFIHPPEARSAATVKLEVVHLGRALDVVEQALATQDFLLAGGFSAADIAMGYVVAVSRVFRPLEGQPRLQEYVRRLRARPAAAGLLEFQVAAAPVAV
jgi:glutathione S-transferase